VDEEKKKMADKLASLLKSSKNTVFFGGAGVSTESGIPDFRSETGLYAARQNYGYPPEQLISRSIFKQNPLLFFRYYKESLIAKDAKPNAAHMALAQLESRGLLQTVITQNIDGLHQAAGSLNVLELHGSNWRQYCVDCGKKYNLEYILNEDNCKDNVIPICTVCDGIVRPDVVLYEEGLNDEIVSAAIMAISSADLLIVGGTSLVVHPAAGFLRCFNGNQLVLINKSETPADKNAQLIIRQSIGKVMTEVMEKI